MMFAWAVLRALAEGRIHWAFWPPGTDPRVVEHQGGVDGAGIWVPDLSDVDDVDVDVESDDDAGSDEGSESDVAEDESEEEGSSPALVVSGASSRFAALSLENGSSDEAED